MRRGPREGLNSPTAWIAIAMAWCAGFVDAVGYVLLDRLYTSHMTGNTASFGVHLVENGRPAARYGWTLLFFVAGMLASTLLRHAERRKGVRSAFAAVLGLEVLALGACIALRQWGHPPEMLVAFLLAAAMGMQTVTVTRVGRLRVYTTYITGNLSKFSESAAEYVVWLRQRTRGRVKSRFRKALAVTPRQVSFQRALLTGGLWVAFFTGAAGGAGSEMKWGAPALFAPLVLLLAVVAIDLRNPVALGETGREELGAAR